MLRKWLGCIRCFVNGLDAYDGEINLALDGNLISNEYAVKLCLDYEVKKRNKVVKQELIVALKGELYFVKFIINPKEDDVEPEVIFGRSFMRLVNGIVDFGSGVITIYPKQDPFEDDSEKTEKNIRPSSSTGRHLTQEEAAKEALAFRISQTFALLEEVRPVLDTMAYNDKYKKVLDEIWKDKVELDGMIVKEEEEAINKVKGEALKEKDDPGAFIFPIRFEGKINKNSLADTRSDINTMPYRIYEKLGIEEIKKVDRGITMINHTQAEPMGILMNVLCQVGVTTIISKFLILDIPIDRDAPIVVGRGFIYTISGIVNTPERLFSTFDGICHQTFRGARSDILRTTESDSNDEEEYEIKRNKFGAPIYGSKPAAYLNCNDPAERSIALQVVINPFRKISVWKKAVSFLGSLPAPLQRVDWKPDYKGYYTNEEEVKGQWRTEIRTMGGNDDEAGSSRSKRSRKYKTMEEVLLPQVHHEFLLWEGCNKEAKSRYNTILANLLPGHVYSPCVVNWDILNRMGCDGEINDMLRIKLREAGSNEEIFTYVAWIRAFNIKEPIYLKLCHELGLYHAEELDEEGFDVYFQGGLRSDEHFNAKEYWYDKIQKNDLWLLIMFDAKHQNGYANMAWLIARWMKRKGVGTQKESQICCGQFITKIARKVRVVNDAMIRSLSALIYCRDLDTITLRELIDSEGRLIPEDPQPGVPRVAIPRPPRASMQDLYDRMGSMEIRQEAIERIEYRQSIISSTHLSHRSIHRSISSSSSRMMMSSVEMKQDGCGNVAEWDCIPKQLITKSDASNGNVALEDGSQCEHEFSLYSCDA
ncbi:hypothetical protein Tco_1101644 [Tanacetum coccineum]